ncbi:hypothetical protein GDO78_008201 [Eleutherodactylus coqui]|uniref:Uncharacterized protein n=1 Tax=Eleutherodactylus coqui TaxID=57060 RepID=A0A8J6FAW6_ELECQ|nr:hypothetical protein GDO78_008201 [Eleutherodactylus coqui]
MFKVNLGNTPLRRSKLLTSKHKSSIHVKKHKYKDLICCICIAAFYKLYSWRGKPELGWISYQKLDSTSFVGHGEVYVIKY